MNHCNLIELFPVQTQTAHHHFVTYEERWELFMSSLLHYPKLSGGGRLKDHPFTTEAHRYQTQFNRLLNLSNRPENINKDSKPRSNYSRYLTLMIASRYLIQLQMKHLDGQLNELERLSFREEYFMRLLSSLVNDLADQAKLDKPQKRLLQYRFNLRSDNQQTSRTHIQELFSITRKTKNKHTSDELVRVGWGSLIKQIFNLADHAAKPLTKEPTSDPEAISIQLKRVQFWLISIKTKKVQSLLDECESHFIRRGASVWCTHVLSIVRDSLLQPDQSSPLAKYADRGIFLILDSSAVLKLGIIHLDENFKLPTNRKELEEELASALQAHMRLILTSPLETQFDRRYPLLTRWRRHAASHPELFDVTAVLPELRVNAECISLEHFCRHTEKYDAQRDPLPVNCSFISADRALLTHHEGRAQCDGRRGELAFQSTELSTPINYTEVVGRESRSTQRYGWSSVVFALVGMSYRQSVDSALVSRLNELKEVNGRCRQRELKLVPSGWRERLAENIREDHELSDPTLRLIMVKLDGDRMGKLFVEATGLDQCQISQEVEGLTQRVYWMSCEKIFSRSILNCHQIDLIYFGGDDLEFIVREDYYERFMKEFANLLYKNPPVYPELQSVTFSYVGVRFTYEEDSLTQLSMVGDDLNLLLKQCIKRPKGENTARPSLAKGELISSSSDEGLSSLNGRYEVTSINRHTAHAEQPQRLYGALLDMTDQP